MLGATLLVLLVASINYQLNLGYLLTFLLAGSVVVGMHVCHGTLRGLAMRLMPPDAAVTRAPAAVFRVVLHNARRSDALRHRPGGAGRTQRTNGSWTDVPAAGQRARSRSPSSPSGAACTACRR